MGKTSLACAAAGRVGAAGQEGAAGQHGPGIEPRRGAGRPAFRCNRPRVPGADGLFALNIDPEAAAKAYRERVIGPYRGVLPDAAINSMEEQLSGACTVEIAAFDEFTKLLGDAQATAGFDHIIFDTAPTGHTLRLLKLPAAWTGFIADEYNRHFVPGATGRARNSEIALRRQPEALTDATTTTLVLVSRPERSSLAEADRSRAELAEMGVANQRLFLNGVFIAQDRTDSAACALEGRGQEAIASMPAGLAEASASARFHCFHMRQWESITSARVFAAWIVGERSASATWSDRCLRVRASAWRPHRRTREERGAAW